MSPPSGYWTGSNFVSSRSQTGNRSSGTAEVRSAAARHTIRCDAYSYNINRAAINYLETDEAGTMLRVISVVMSASIVLLNGIGKVHGAGPIAGRASVTDGDTLVIRDTKVRLHGIDAPESAQTCQDMAGKDYQCGQAAALALSNRIGEASISCEARDTDRYGRMVAVCRKDSEDLNAWMVAQGHAIAYRRYSTDYVTAEDQAKAAKRGIWAGAFTTPSDWRRGERARGMGFAAPGGPDGPIPAPAGRAETPAPGSCAIKGNISREGEKVFHVPGSRDYDRTRIIEKSGERMFCTEDEAKAAGWRAPRG